MLSFIVPAQNEAELLPATLASIRSAASSTGESFELLVVDDASTDGTAEIARAAGAHVVSVNLRQIAAVRNAGARLATGEILVFLDADTILPGETLRAALAALASGAIGGGARLAFEGLTALWARWLPPLLNPIGQRLRWAPGCFFFVRREAFDAVGGFDERYFAAEEIVLSRALKRQGRFVIVDAPVRTSGRKGTNAVLLKTVWLLLRMLVGGGKVLQRREGLEIWYSRPQKPTPACRTVSDPSRGSVPDCFT